MRYIVPIAVIGIVLLDWSGAVPISSASGPWAIVAACFAAALAVGMHEAWVAKRGAPGWAASIVVALAGAYLAASIGGDAMGILLIAHADTALAMPTDLLAAITLAAMMLVALFGAWGGLWLLNRLPSRRM